MELSNAIAESPLAPEAKECYLTLVKMLHPFAPHVTEEIGESFGEKGLVVTSPWPVADPERMREEVMTIVVQVNGKLRGQVEVSPAASEDAVIAAAKSNEKVAHHLEGKSIAKTIYVPGRLLNLVVR